MIFGSTYVLVMPVLSRIHSNLLAHEHLNHTKHNTCVEVNLVDDTVGCRHHVELNTYLALEATFLEVHYENHVSGIVQLKDSLPQSESFWLTIETTFLFHAEGAKLIKCVHYCHATFLVIYAFISP